MINRQERSMDDTKQTGKQVAQPADEELKKHGDQLERQVKDAAGQQERRPNDGQRKDEGNRR
jgi:hypothetical protein